MALHLHEGSSLVLLPTKVPNLVELADRLGFGKFGSRPMKELAESTHLWRKQYRCEDGSPGTALLDWKSSLVREKVRAMTLRYLDDAGYGQLWWPQSTGAKDLKWQYNKDHDRYVNECWPENPGVAS